MAHPTQRLCDGNLGSFVFHIAMHSIKELASQEYVGSIVLLGFISGPFFLFSRLDRSSR
jgi:hypothetical protein